MYRLFYNHEVTGDVLFVLLDPEKKPTRVVRKGQVAALYAGEELVGVNIFDFSSVVKLKANGVLFTPSATLLLAVNPLLVNAGLPALSSCADSGYHVAEITALEEHPLDEKAQIVTLSLGEKKATTVSWYPNLKVGEHVVVATDGCILYDGSVFHSFVSRNIPSEVSILSAKELKLPETPSGAFLAEGYQAGEDFFLGGH